MLKRKRVKIGSDGKVARPRCAEDAAQDTAPAKVDAGEDRNVDAMVDGLDFGVADWARNLQGVLADIGMGPPGSRDHARGD